MKSYQDLKQIYSKPTLTVKYIELEESIAVASVVPNNGESQVKEEWDELGDVYQDVEW